MNHDTPSATAILIAKSIVFVAGNGRYRSLMPPAMVDLSGAFLRSVLSGWQLTALTLLGRFPPARWLVQALERRSVPGMLGHYILRKRRLQELVDETAQRLGGLQQLVILGAGFDTLGARMAAQRPDLGVFELDHPATSAAKRRAFERGYAVLPENLTLLPADLSQVDPQAVLGGVKHFSFSAKTLFIAEGVFMYLTLADVGKTLDLLFAFPEGHAAFAFTYMLPSEEDGRPSFRGQTFEVDRWLGRQSEPFVWGATPEALDSFVRKRGLKPINHTDAMQLRQAYLKNPAALEVATAVGENIAWLER